jgi:hypothetical protein
MERSRETEDAGTEVTAAGSEQSVPMSQAHADVTDPAGDAADQADRLTSLMESEAVYQGLHSAGPGTDDVPGPLEDLEEVLAEEDADDASDDPMHAGGLTPARWMSAEQAAMHVVDDSGVEADRWLSDETDTERADPLRDQFDGTPGGLTAEDQTILGIDPYE